MCRKHRPSGGEDCLEAGRIVGQLHQEGLLRRIVAVDEEFRDDLARRGVVAMPGIPAADAASLGDHLPPVSVVTNEFNDATHDYC